jgi:hypothetical protein
MTVTARERGLSEHFAHQRDRVCLRYLQQRPSARLRRLNVPVHQLGDRQRHLDREGSHRRARFPDVGLRP